MMDAGTYIVTTLSNSFGKLAPWFIFIVGGYFVFIKMPFLFFRKSMEHQKKKLEEENKDLKVVEKYSVEDYLEFQKKMKLMNGETPKLKSLDQERPRQERPKEEQRQKQEEQQKQHKQQKQQKPHTQQGQQRQEQKKEYRREEKKEEKREPPKTPQGPPSQSPEEVFSFSPGQKFTKGELKKRYFELLKQNHPDRVASMGEDFKKLAEKNTKEINKAYEHLQKKAA